MARVEGKVALITGAARGQGRSHAVRLAEEGADIIAVDLCGQIDSVPYGMATPDDLAETAKLVEEQDRRIVAAQADVRDAGQLQAAVEEGLSQFGHIDIVSANAGIASFGPAHELDETAWRDMLDVNLTGVWRTCKAVIPSMIEAGRGGSMILTSSTAGLKGFAGGAGHYIAAKHGVVGLMRTLANELAPHMIRVNTVHPTGVSTDMVQNDFFTAWAEQHPEIGAAMQNLLPVEMVEPRDISNAVLWLASDEARYVTGVTLPVDAGITQK
jgi:SDR family mycofactocin-dependent oxidoreductase